LSRTFLANISGPPPLPIRPAGQVSFYRRSTKAPPLRKGTTGRAFSAKAEIEILLVSEAYQTPGGTVTAQRRLLGAREIQTHDPLHPLVEPGALLPHTMEDCARGRLIFAGPAALPATTDHRNSCPPCAGCQLVGNGVSLHEGTGQNRGGAMGRLDYPGAFVILRTTSAPGTSSAA
jgi:hypothetical protein